MRTRKGHTRREREKENYGKDTRKNVIIARKEAWKEEGKAKGKRRRFKEIDR